MINNIPDSATSRIGGIPSALLDRKSWIISTDTKQGGHWDDGWIFESTISCRCWRASDWPRIWILSKEADISTIEIDLSKKNGITSVEELEEILLSESEEKQWKYNSESKQYLDSLYKAADKKDISYLGRIAYVENCPIEIQCRSVQPDTLYQDCRNCQYCLSYNYDDGILCLGRRSILTANDLDFSEAELKKDSKMELESYVDFSFASGLCPRCGGKLFEGEGKHGSGWCCMNYPYCSFTASVDPSTGEIIMTG